LNELREAQAGTGSNSGVPAFVFAGKCFDFLSHRLLCAHCDLRLVSLKPRNQNLKTLRPQRITAEDAEERIVSYE
jgi:hypothetical protein